MQNSVITIYAWTRLYSWSEKYLICFWKSFT